MRIGNVILDTDYMAYSEIDSLIQELRKIRQRKSEAKDCMIRMRNLTVEAKDHNFVYTNRYTGEIFDPNDWFVYDEAMELTHGEEVEK